VLRLAAYRRAGSAAAAEAQGGATQTEVSAPALA
jgi:hypothetical protein